MFGFGTANFGLSISALKRVDGKGARTGRDRPDGQPLARVGRALIRPGDNPETDPGQSGEQGPDMPSLTYAELAQALKITPASANKLARRRRWPRVPGNDGKARVAVPEEVLVRRDSPPASPPDVRPVSPPDNPVHAEIARLERELVTEARARADAAEARAEAAKSRAESRWPTSPRGTPNTPST